MATNNKELAASIVELLGGSTALAIVKLMNNSGLTYAQLINTDKALSIILGIFLSVAIAFVFGYIVMWITRLVFTFKYKDHSRWAMGIFGGISITLIMFFLLVFFMISTLYMVNLKTVDVNMPKAASAQTQMNVTYLVTLKKDGTLYLEDKPIEEKALIKQLAHYSEVVRLAARDYDPSHINRYLTELAAAFHKFYTVCRIKGEEKPVLLARLKLADAARAVLKNGMVLIGCSAPEKM